VTTQSPTWKHLTQLAARAVERPLSDWLEESDRFARFSFSAPGLLMDLSKQRLDAEVFDGLMALARDQELSDRIDGLFAGAMLNPTEQRPALHTLLRAPAGSDPRSKDVHQTLARVAELAHAVRSGTWRGATGKPIDRIIHIGIGGSHLGPELVLQALRQRHGDLDVRFVANVDPGEVREALRGCDPERTLFVAASKTFGTLETLINASAARDWLLERSQGSDAVGRHFVAISSNVGAAEAFGIPSENVLPMWDWVGGRYSLWSAVGLPIALGVGFDAFTRLLEGAHAMDEHFANTDLERNVPVLMALTGVWNCNFLGANNLAILPYDQRLSLLPSFLQQLEMESNGKSVSLDGEPLKLHSAPIVWGGVGTNGQHAFHQLLHQGTRSFAADFILVGNDPGADEQQRWLLANGLAQSQAMMAGNQTGDPHTRVPGGHATTTLLLEQLDPFSLGALLAAYEHKVFCQGIIWNINSFDQFGVELGKSLAQPIFKQLGGQSALHQDASTRGLIERLRKGVRR